MQSEETAGLEASVKKIKQSSKFKPKKHSKKEIAKAQAKAQRLERERDQAISRLKELEELLEKLPEIFESKFSQRLSPVLERQRLLVEENSHLREQVEHLMSQLGDLQLDFPQPSNRASIAFIGLKPNTATSLQHLFDEQVTESSATEVPASSRRLNVA